MFPVVEYLKCEKCVRNPLLHLSEWNMASYFTRMLYFHSPSARENTATKELAIFHSDECNKVYIYI